MEIVFNFKPHVSRMLCLVPTLDVAISYLANFSEKSILSYAFGLVIFANSFMA